MPPEALNAAHTRPPLRYTVVPNTAVSPPLTAGPDVETEAVLLQMRQIRDPRTPLLTEWVHHPDERVVIAALRYKRYADGVSPFVPEVLERALGAPRLGYFWTPLLDALAARREGRAYGVLPLLLERLMASTALNGTADDLRIMLANFESGLFLEAVASRGPHLTLDMAWRLLRQDLAEQLAFNPFASESVLEAVVSHVIDDEVLRRRRNSYDEMSKRGRYVSVLDALVRAGFPMPANRVAKLAGRLSGLRRVMYPQSFQQLQLLVRANLRRTVGEMTPSQRKDVASLFADSDGESRLQSFASL